MVVCNVVIPNPPTMFIPGYPNAGGTFVDVVDYENLAECTVDTSGWGRIVEFTAYPVPFDKKVNIRYAFEFDTAVKIEVFDIKGTLIKTDINNYA